MSLLLLFSLLGCGGCNPPEPAPTMPEPAPGEGGKEVSSEEAWNQVRTHLIKPKDCFRSRKAYCPTNPELADPFIQNVLDRQFQSSMPTNTRFLPAITKASAANLRKHWATQPALRAHIEERVRAYHAEGKARAHDGYLLVDLGTVPGRFDAKGVWHSDQTVDSHWATPQMAAQLKKWSEATGDNVRLLAEWPVGAGKFIRGDIRWDAQQRKVLQYSKLHDHEVWVSPVIEDWQPYLDGTSSLHPDSQQHCTTTAYGAPPQCPGDEPAKSPE